MSAAKMSSGDSESACVVCFKTVDIYSLGECDHPVCFECSTRMRVLCLQNECPICRHQLHKVIFTSECVPYKEISTQAFSDQFFDRKYKIAFIDLFVKQAYLKLLEHNCKKCGSTIEPFRNFAALETHMKNVHDLHYCDLCVENLRIFTLERKCYTRGQLSLHRRKGDLDDSSHKGHPLCEFCDKRFMDTDELYRHLRKHHLYCHLCDADGYDHYYGSYDCLRDHFRKEHYLCEEGECIEQNLTAVFRSDIDLIAHKATEHGKGLSKQAARQARTLELQFTLTPRPPRPNQRGPVPLFARPDREEEEIVREVIKESAQHNATNVSIDTGSKEQFPSLGANPASPIITMNRPATMVVRQNQGALVKSDQNFPALGNASGSSTSTLRVNITHQPGPSSAGPSNAIIKSNAGVMASNGISLSKPNVSIQVHNRPTTANNFKLEPAKINPGIGIFEKKSDMKKFEDEFPSLNKKDKNLLFNDYCSSAQTTASIAKKISEPVVVQNVAIPKPIVMAQPKAPPPPSSNAFPALCPTSSYVPPRPQWIVAAKPRDKQPKPSKVAPTPIIPSVTDINSPTDFPSLAIKTKSKKGNKNELNNNRSPEEEKQTINNNKKEKKKGNILQISFEKNKKNVPPDNASDKFFTVPKKSEPEPTWNEWKGKKNPNANVKPKEKTPIEEPVKKVNAPNLIQDFPALSSAKHVPGFKNANSKDSYSENLKSKLSYSENLKIKSESKNKKVSNGESAKVNQESDTVIPPCNGFTFTNSSGQEYNISAHSYIEPPDFFMRNAELVYSIKSALDSQDSIDEFKDFSRKFREGVYSAETYFQHCMNTIESKFDLLFPELLALLPDITKQQELHKVYSTISNSTLQVCAMCGQVLIPEDYVTHVDSHSVLENFPALGAAVHSGSARRK